MRIIRKFVLAGLFVALNTMAFAHNHQHDGACAADGGAEKHSCGDAGMVFKPQANINSCILFTTLSVNEIFAGSPLLGNVGVILS